MANCCVNGLNQIFCNAFNKYYNTLYTNGEISKEETNNLLIIDYIRQCLSDDRYSSYYNILLKALRCIANNSCLLDTSWLYNRSIVPKITNLFVTILTKQAFVETDPIFSASPAATITDEDIDNWNNPSTSGGALIVTVTLDGTYSADKTFTEIFTAWNSGLDVIVCYSDAVYQVSWIDDGGAWFFRTDKTNAGPYIDYFAVDGTDDSWTKNTYNLQERLVSGTNIKTINSSSILGGGNVNLLTPSFCPIILDTRSSAVAAITGVAPFSELVDGQILIVRLGYNTANNTTLNLTLSGGTTTGAINIYIDSARQSEVWVGDSFFRANDYMMIVYDNARTRWRCISQIDTSASYSATTQALIDAGTDATARVISPKLLCDNFTKIGTFNNFYPIIEDTRSSASATTITGDAPFASLEDGQRIVLHFKYANTASPTLQLTLSGGTTTSAYSLYQNYNNGVNALTVQAMPAGSYGEFVFDSTNSRWVLVGKDFNTTYSNTTQADINSAAQGSRLIEPKLIHDNAYIVSLAYSSGSLKANKFYDFGTVSTALTIPSLDATNDLVSNALNFYALRFIAGADNISITFPTGVLVDDTPTINTDDYVEIMINLYVVNGSSNFYASIKVWQAQ